MVVVKRGCTFGGLYVLSSYSHAINPDVILSGRLGSKHQLSRVPCVSYRRRVIEGLCRYAPCCTCGVVLLSAVNSLCLLTTARPSMVWRSASPTQTPRSSPSWWSTSTTPPRARTSEKSLNSPCNRWGVMLLRASRVSRACLSDVSVIVQRLLQASD